MGTGWRSADLQVSRGKGPGLNADLKVGATRMRERTGNVYENKGQGQKVEESRGSESLCLGTVIIRLENWRNKARMSMKTKERSRNQPPPYPSSDEEGLGVVRLCGLGGLRGLA